MIPKAESSRRVCGDRRIGTVQEFEQGVDRLFKTGFLVPTELPSDGDLLRICG